MTIVIVGLTITSSWGNGHASTYRSLVRALAQRGHDVLFLERDVPWYACQRDLPRPAYCRVSLYDTTPQLATDFGRAIATADLVVVGSYVPDGVEAADIVLRAARGCTAFYDIDTPITLAALHRGDTTYLERRQVPAFDLYLSFAGGPSLSRLEEEFGARRARPLYCSVDPDTYAPVAATPSRDLTYLGTYSTDRQPVLERLLLEVARRWPSGRFAVAGAQYPGDLDWPSNVERLEHVPPHAHAAFYGTSRFTLNVTRRDMVAAGHSPSVRLFEAAACAVPVISDCWPGLEQFFEPGRDILLAEHASHVLSCLRDIADDDRCAIAARARTRVLASHTAAQRARELEAYVSEAAARDRSPRLETSASRSA